MTTRIICLACCIVLFGLRSIGSTEPLKKMPVIGVLLPENASANAAYVAALVQGLRELNHVVDQNIRIEYRYADGKRERFSPLAEELVRQKVT